MRHIAIISTGYMWFPCESGTVRMFEVASAFEQAGYTVDLYVPDFQHHQKSVRDKELIYKNNYPFNIYFAHAYAYQKNISIKRIASNKKLAGEISRILKSHIKEYDGVLLSIPPNDVAKKVAMICKKYSVPLMVDVEDLWPKAMKMVMGDSFLSNVLLSGFERDAEYVYKNVDAVIGTSPDYRDKAFEYTGRDIPSDVVYVGCDLETFDKGVSRYAKHIKKPDDEAWVTYAGSISNSYDIENLVAAGKVLKTKGVSGIRINILGNGTNKKRLEEMARLNGLNNVTFFGFVPYQEMAAMLSRSDILINSFIKRAPQSIVNKIADYLAAGKPIINTLENPVFCKLVDEHNIGINVKSENPVALANAIVSLVYNGTKMKQMGENARRLCIESFDAKDCNAKVIGMMEKCIENGKIS